MSADRVTSTVLAAARTHRPDAAEIEQIFPGIKAWFGIFTREWWAYLPHAGAFAGPAGSPAALREMILAVQARPARAGTRHTFTTIDPAPSAATVPPAADRAARGAEPPTHPAGSAPRNHRTRGGRHARR